MQNQGDSITLIDFERNRIGLHSLFVNAINTAISETYFCAEVEVMK